jgi:hypothetical protein
MPRLLSPLQVEIPRLAMLARNDTSQGAWVVTQAHSIFSPAWP